MQLEIVLQVCDRNLIPILLGQFCIQVLAEYVNFRCRKLSSLDALLKEKIELCECSDRANLLADCNYKYEIRGLGCHSPAGGFGNPEVRVNNAQSTNTSLGIVSTMHTNFKEVTHTQKNPV
jgi:hypothetical protein